MTRQSTTSIATVSRWIILLLTLLSLGSCETGRTGNRSVTFAAALLPSEQQQYIRILNVFTERTGIRVNLVAQQYEQIREVLAAQSAAGEGDLDLIEIDVHMLWQVSPSVVTLKDRVKGLDSLSKEVTGEVWNAGSPRGELKFLPHRLNWQALVYDAERLNRPPATWNDLLNLGRRMPGAIGLKGARYEGMVCDLFPFLWQAGADPLHPESPDALVALKFLEELAPLLNRSTRTFKENTILQAEEHREIVLHMNWPFVVPLLREKGLLPQRFKTAPLPSGPRGRATVLGGAYLAIPKTSAHAREASELLEFLVSSEAQRMLVRNLGWFPIRDEDLSVLSDEENTIYEGFLVMRNHVRSRPAVPYYNELSNLWQEAFARILYEGAKAEAVVSDLTASLTALRKGGGE